MAIFEKRNICVYHFLQAAQSHQLMCPYGPLLNEQTVGSSGTVQRDLFSATRNQTFSGGEEKLLFSCANFVDQTKSASSKCSDKDMNFCMCRVDEEEEEGEEESWMRGQQTCPLYNTLTCEQ